jgi:hypothetical protein
MCYMIVIILVGRLLDDWCRRWSVGSITTTQIIAFKWCTTLFTLVIQSVCACLEVTLEPWRSCLLLTVRTGPSCRRANWSASSCSLKRLPVEVTLRLTGLGIEHLCGTCDHILFPVGMLSEICGLVSIGRPLWREDGSAICSVITQYSESPYFTVWDSPNLEGQVPVFISPRNRVAQFYAGALGSLYVVSYDSQGYGGGILTFPFPGGTGPCIYSLQE